MVTWLNEEIEQRGWSIREFGRQVNISHTHAARIANGEVDPSADLCLEIARVFNVPPEFVMRKAKKLPPRPETVGAGKFIAEVTDILRDLPLEDRKYLFEIARLHYQRVREQRGMHELSSEHAPDPQAP